MTPVLGARAVRVSSWSNFATFSLAAGASWGALPGPGGGLLCAACGFAVVFVAAEFDFNCRVGAFGVPAEWPVSRVPRIGAIPVGRASPATNGAVQVGGAGTQPNRRAKTG